jgi:hypothetical protein
MAAHTKIAVGYNIQVAVDAKNEMIVDQEVTNQVLDMGLLTQTAEPQIRSGEIRLEASARRRNPAKRSGFRPIVERLLCRNRS